MATRRLPAHEAEKFGYSWVILITSFMLRMIVFGQLYSLGVLYIHWLQEFGKPRGETAWIASIATGTTLLMGPFSAVLYNIFPLRNVVMIAAFTSSLGVIFSYFAESILFLYISLGIVTGVSGGIVNFGAVVSLERYFSKNRPFAMGIGSAGTGIGGMIYGFLQEYLIHKYSWRESMLIMGGIQLNMIVFGALMIEPTAENLVRYSCKRKVLPANAGSCCPTQKPSTNSLSTVGSESSMESEELKREEEEQLESKHPATIQSITIKLVKKPIFLFLFCCDFLSWMVQYVPYVHIPVRAKTLGFENNAFLISTMGLSSAAGKAVFGIICTHYRKKSYSIYTFTQFIFAATVLLSPLCVSLWSLTLFSVAFGFFSGNYCIMMIIPADLLGEKFFSVAYGILLASEGVGVYLGPPLIGWLSELWDSYSASLLAAGVILLFSASSLLPIYWLKKRPNRGESLVV